MADLSAPGTYAVVIGTGTHRRGSALPDVPAVDSTVEDIRACLIDRCGLDPTHLEVRLNPSDPGELEALIRSKSHLADGLFILFYVGHGIIDEHRKLHLATASTADPDRVEYGRTLPYEIIEDAIYGMEGRERDRATVIILDCCYSGRVTAATGTVAQAGFSQSAMRGTYVLTSTAANDEAWAPIGKRHTSFSGGLIDLLTTGDPYGPSTLDFNSVYDYLARYLRREGAPQPRRHVEDNVGRIALARNPAYQQPLPRPPHLAGQVGEPAKPSCPYMGLQPFDIDDHALFFGRESLIAQLIKRMRNRLAEPGIQVVTGPSGVGKTSLLRAGMMHAIASGELNVQGSSSWDQLPSFTPGDDPLLSFASVLAQHLPASASWNGSPERLCDHLKTHPELAGDLLRRLRPSAGQDNSRRVILVIDQFEEVFTACQDEATRVAFFRALRATALPAADGRPPAALVALGVRSDFLGMCGSYPELNEALGATVFLVGPMSRDELRQAIVKPAKFAGLALEDGLVEVLLRDADPGMTLGRSDAGVQGILPLLSHALAVTWRRSEYEQWHDVHGHLHSGWSLKTASYEKAGGIRGALSATAEATYGSLSEGLQDKARLIFLSLVESRNEAGAFIDVRRRVRRDEFRADSGGNQAADVIINAFADARLLTIDDTHVEIVHEALLRAWPRLGSWIDEDRERLLARQRLSAATAAWNSENRHPSALLQGPRLAAARLLLTNGVGRAELSKLDADFLSRSVRRARRRARRLYALAIVAVIILVLGADGGDYILNQRSLARQQENLNQVEQLITESRTVSQSNPRLSVLLALDAYHRYPSAQTYAQLETDLTQTRYAGMLAGGTNAVESVAYQPTKSGLLASADSDGTVKLWEPAKGDQQAAHETNLQVGSFKVPGGAYDLAFSSDGGILAVSSSNGQIQLWSVRNPSRPTYLTHLSAVGNGDQASVATTYVAFTPQGNTLAATDDESTLTTWDVASTGQPKRLSQADVSSGCPQAEGDGDISFSPDGQTLLIGCYAVPGASLWDMSNPDDPRRLSTLTPPTIITPSRSFSTSAVAFSPDGHTVAVAAGYSPATFLWNVTNRESPAFIKKITGQGRSISSVAFSADGSRLATTSWDDTTELWDITDPAAPEEMAMLQGQEGSVNTAAFSPDGNTLATGSDDTTVMLWNADINANTPALAAIPDQYGTADTVSTVAMSGHILAIGYSRGTVGLWNISNPEKPVRFTTLTNSELGDSPQYTIDALTFSPNGGILAVAGDANGESDITLWRMAGNPAPPTFLCMLSPSTYSLLAFNDTGTLLATVYQATSDTAEGEVFNVTNPREPRLAGPATALPPKVTPITLAFDGELMAVGQQNGEGGVALYDTSNPSHPTALVNLDRGDLAYSAAFSPDGKFLASTTSNSGVAIWSVANKRHPTQMADLTGNIGVTTAVAFGPDDTLAASGYDHTVILYDLAEPSNPVQAASLNNQFVGQFSFSPNSQILVTQSTDFTVTLWSIASLIDSIAQPVRVGCGIAQPKDEPSDWSVVAQGSPYQPGCS